MSTDLEAPPDFLLKNTRYAIDVLGGPSATARLLGVSQPTVSAWSLGTSRPREEIVLKLAQLLLVSPATMRYGDAALWKLATAIKGANLRGPLWLFRAEDGHACLSPSPCLGVCACGMPVGAIECSVGWSKLGAKPRCLGSFARRAE